MSVASIIAILRALLSLFLEAKKGVKIVVAKKRDRRIDSANEEANKGETKDLEKEFGKLL